MTVGGLLEASGDLDMIDFRLEEFSVCMSLALVWVGGLFAGLGLMLLLHCCMAGPW